MNNNNDEHQTPNRKLETQVAREFMNILSTRANELTEKYGSDPKQFKLEPHERKVLLKVNNSGILEAAAASILVLVGLRRTRAYLLKRAYIAHKKSQSGGHNPMSPPPSSGGATGAPGVPPPPPPAANGAPPPSPMQQLIQNRHHQQHQMPKNPFAQAGANGGTQSTQVPREPFLWRMFAWGLDIATAGALGMVVGTYAMDMEKVVDEMAQLPLSPGRSTVVKEFCPRFQEWILDLQKQADNGNQELAQVLHNAQNPSVAGFVRFAQNCDKRLRYEAILRREKGVTSPSYQVEVPSPGVPLDVDDHEASASHSSSSWVGGGEEFVNEDDFTDDDGGDNSSWAEGFAQDQEEHDKSRRN